MAQNESTNNRVNSLKKIRCKYILSQIFNNINQVTKLNIIKYNKSLMNTLGVKIKDYINAFSNIEIEIIPVAEPGDRFIYLPNKKNLSNYIIYFDDKKINLLTNRNTPSYVKKIKVVINYRISSLYQLFFKLPMHQKDKFYKI